MSDRAQVIAQTPLASGLAQGLQDGGFLRRKSVFCAVAVLLWVVTSLPAILLSKWFPLDLPTIFRQGDHLATFLPWILSPYNGSGRYFPIYWIYNCVQTLMFGTAVGPFLLVQSLLFLATALMACRIVYRMTGDLRAATFLLAAIYLCSPTSENLTTIGKAEPLACFFVVAILWIFYQDWIKQRLSLMYCVAIGVLFALAIWTKETSLLLIGFGAAGLFCIVLFRMFRRGVAEAPHARSFVMLLVALAAGFGIARLPYLISPVLKISKSYTDYQITADIVSENLIFYVTQQPDVLLFGLLALAFLGIAAKDLIASKKASEAEDAPNVIFVASLCAMAWAYYLGLLLWRWPMAYYMLLPGIAFRLCAVYAFYRVARRQLITKKVALATASAASLALAYSTIIAFYISSSQIAYSRVYTEALQAYHHASRGKGSLIIESYPFTRNK